MKQNARTWSLQEAKAKFSEVVRRANAEGPQTVTVHGQASVLVVKAPTTVAVEEKLTGADFIKRFQTRRSFDFELPPRPTHAPSRRFSFDDETS